MPQFCTNCGTYQTDKTQLCISCGESHQDVIRISPLEWSDQPLSILEGKEFLPDEITSPRRYVWLKITRPWRRQWSRGTMWKIILTATLSATIIGTFAGLAIFVMI